ncbi:MAG: phage tail assembly protein [Chloroflexi bacterium]|nr:MAG: phage tail assembly protein [Chloroflexota bacterium]
MVGLQTEFEFTLPRGYIDQEGNLHRHGVMRLATAMDEIIPLQDRRVRENQAYLVIILLSRVIVKLGTLPSITPTVIENLFAADLAYLQTFYRQINEEGYSRLPVTCPACQHQFEVDLSDLGGES